MNILYVGMKYDYGEPNRGLSFEHYNLFDPLLKMGHNLLYFDFDTLIKQNGRAWINRRIDEIVKAEKPDLTFFVLFESEFDMRTIRKISDSGLTTTLNWFCDDHWRFDAFSVHWAVCFNWVVTTSSRAFQRYLNRGIKNVIKSQWGCNHFLYQKMDLEKIYDVTFIGQPHGFRPQIIAAIKKEGINVQVWGHGWDSGRISQEDMIRIFNQSKINLNFTNASIVINPQVDRWYQRFKYHFPRLTNLVLSFTETKTPIRLFQKLMIPQIKARNFEIPGCEGFLITDKAEDIEDYYEENGEIVCFKNTRDLIRKIKYYLANPEESLHIAKQGYQRTILQHTYEQRFRLIFDKMGIRPMNPAVRIEDTGGFNLT